MAMGANPEIREATATLELARSQRGGSISEFLPRVDLSLRAGTKKDMDPTTQDPTPEVSREHNEYVGSIRLKQPIFSGFSSIHQIESFDAETQRAEFQLQKKFEEIRLATLQDYFEIQLDLAKISAEDEVLTANQRQLNISEDRFGAGSVTEVDVLRAKLAVESQKPVVASLRSGLEKKKLRFAQRVGLALDRSFELTVTLESAHKIIAETKPPELSAVLSQAFESNNEVRSLRSERQKLLADIALVRAGHWPKLDLVANADTVASVRDEIGSPDSQRYAFALEFNLPLFTGLSSLTETGTATARIKSIEARFETLKQDLLQDLNAARRDLELSELRANSGKVSIELAERTVRQTTSQYQAGRTTLTEVLNSSTELSKARKDYAQAHFDGISALAKLRELAGSAWPNSVLATQTTESEVK